jgi:RHS repeat-associated protein
VVPAGALKDGQAYHWRVKTSDLIVGKNNRQPRERKSATTRQFTVSLKKWGSDPRWAMWSHGLGNGMQLEVNQANGNLFLDYPLDSLATPAGPLDLSLAYNSQQTHDFDVPGRWVVSVGPGGERGPMPVRLSVPAWGGVQIRFSDGSRQFFPKLEGDHYGSIGGGAGLVTRSDGGPNDPRWRYRTATGSKYAFRQSGALLYARSSTGDVTGPGFEYGYTQVGTDERISFVRDPLGREVTFSWVNDGANDRLVGISTWDWSWDLFYDGSGRLESITDPTLADVSFGYLAGSAASLATITDGEDHFTSVGYASPIPDKPAKVASVTLPGVGTPYTFEYSGPFTGQMAARTDVADPRAPGTPDPQDFTSRTWFNVAGLPIRVDGPRDEQDRWGMTTQLWDENSNLICRRSPAANSLALGCDNPGNPAPNGLQTDWTYQNRAPYLVKTERAPQNSQGQRALTTYGYDEGMHELYAEYFSNVHLAGEPVGAGFESSLNQNWGQGAPAALGGQTQNWSLRLTGRLEITTGRTHFRVLSDANDGLRLTVGSKLVFDCWNDAQACQDEDFLFEEGEKRFVLEFRDLGGSARSHLRWRKASQGLYEEVPSADLAPEVNLLTSVADPAGTTTYTYTGQDKAKRRVSSETRAGRTTSYAYDQYGRITQITDPLGHQTTNTYTGACLTNVVDRTGAVTRFQCNGAGDVTEQTTVIRAAGPQPPQERYTTTSYDALGRVDVVTAHRNGTPETVVDNNYDSAGRLIETTDGLGAVTHYDYNDRGLLTEEIRPDPDGAGPQDAPLVRHAYEGAGNRVTTTDARGKVWRTTYDALNRVIATRDPLCELYTDSDPRCSLTETTYDFTLNLVRSKDPAGVENTSSFDLVGQKVSEQVGGIPAATFTYDPAGRLTQETDPAGVVTTRTYNSFGAVTSETRPTGPAGALKTTSYDHDAGGRMTKMTDALGRETLYGYDDEGRLTSVTLPLSPPATTTYVLDDAGELVRITGADGRVRDAEFDERGRRTSMRDARGSTSYIYDAASRLTQVGLPNGVVQHFDYDALGRRTRRFGGSPSEPVDEESYTYDPAGNMTGASTSSGTVAMSYDPAGRIQTVSAQGATSTYGYEKGRLVEQADPGGTSTFAYNPDGQLHTITGPFGTTVTYGYYPNGRKHTRTVTPAALSSTWSYDEAGRVETLATTRAGAPLASAHLDYDALGNVTSKDQQIAGLPTSENGAWNYVYDEASRLTAATPPSGPATTYGYDQAGNRISVKVGTQPAVTTSYDVAGHPDSASDGTDYVTDATGALTKITRPGSIGGLTGTTEYTYDTWGRLARAHMIHNPAVPPKAPETVTYAYDALDRMITRATGLASASLVPTTYRYAGQSQDMVKQTKLEGTPVAETHSYSHSPEGPLASSWTTVTSSGTSWYATDPHGDLVAEVSTTATTGSRSYSPWGEERAASGTAPGPFGFQGDWTDPSTDLVDMTTRLYDTGLGRFTTRDSWPGELSSPLTLNQFSFVLGNPITLSDPTGMCPPANPTCPSAENQGIGTKDPDDGVAGAISNYEPEPPEPPMLSSQANVVKIAAQVVRVVAATLEGTISLREAATILDQLLATSEDLRTKRALASLLRRVGSLTRSSRNLPLRLIGKYLVPLDFALTLLEHRLRGRSELESGGRTLLESGSSALAGAATAKACAGAIVASGGTATLPCAALTVFSLFAGGEFGKALGDFVFDRSILRTSNALALSRPCHINRVNISCESDAGFGPG